MNLVSNPEIWHIDYMEMTMRLLLSILLGGFIGFEREVGGHSAGFRTHILVCLGSAVIMLLSMYGFSQFASEPNVRLDPARLAAQVISGIGFLGAGTILRNGMTVSGLTTAASLWVVAAIGLSVGAGFYYGAIIAACMVVVSLFFLNKTERVFSRAKKDREISFRIARDSNGLHDVITRLNMSGIQVYKVNIENEDSGGISGEMPSLSIRMRIKLKKTRNLDETLLALAQIDGMMSLEMEGGLL
ncbi:MgtC/SapB family protein [Paenibacillus caui]|uniref:MgtC/SapB family protein n=1 Tax=Paenibacillus caui TaxID=2873927 RepID=UPI001CA875C7|nr:MgtC/SapB family protein [Paenibacillus caui]